MKKWARVRTDMFDGSEDMGVGGLEFTTLWTKVVKVINSAVVT